jgi:hypothetical protein
MLAGLALLALLACGCAESPKEKKVELTQHQRDSILSLQPLPGASVVGGALKASGQAQEHAAELDSLSQ